MAAMTARIRVRITPRAGRDAIAGWRGETLLVRVAAPPVEGEANAALVRLLARTLGLPKSAVSVIVGAKGREKTVAVEGLDEAEALRRLRKVMPP
jgi:uncharacterized protein (TIGR00251 family)